MRPSGEFGAWRLRVKNTLKLPWEGRVLAYFFMISARVALILAEFFRIAVACRAREPRNGTEKSGTGSSISTRIPGLEPQDTSRARRSMRTTLIAEGGIPTCRSAWTVRRVWLTVPSRLLATTITSQRSFLNKSEAEYPSPSGAKSPPAPSMSSTRPAPLATELDRWEPAPERVMRLRDWIFV